MALMIERKMAKKRHVYVDVIYSNFYEIFAMTGQMKKRETGERNINKEKKNSNVDR